jgi:PS-10 peptidase S37
MKKIKNIFALGILIIISVSFYLSAQSELEMRLKSLEGVVEVISVKDDSLYTEAYEIFVRQPLDHNNPAGKQFNQKLYLSNVDESLPMVIELDGYNVDKIRYNELSHLLKCNRIIVEHRYFGHSKPDTLDWKYLTVQQAAEDDHHIIQIFKGIYKNKWISTGISKGGQTTIFHRYFYPEDVDVSVPYVAPLCLAEEDPRIYSFLKSVGTEDCRNKMIALQRELLKREDELLPLFKKDAEEMNYTFSIASDRMIYEYAVLEYGFAFWQWQKSTCEEIPSPDTTNEALFEHFKLNAAYDYFSDEKIESIAPFFYQAYSELGYYGYDITNFKDLLQEVKEPTSKIFVPKNSNPHYHCSLMGKINTWVQKHGNNMLFIYGGNDTWFAPSVQLTGETNAIKMVKRGGSHKTRIKSFDEKEKEIIYSTLEKWLDIKIER